MKSLIIIHTQKLLYAETARKKLIINQPCNENDRSAVGKINYMMLKGGFSRQYNKTQNYPKNSFFLHHIHFYILMFFYFTFLCYKL